MEAAEGGLFRFDGSRFTPWDRFGEVGLPAPGIELKLVPLGAERFDVRLKGPNITPGYWRQPEVTAAAFDDEGFYRLGDALRFLDPRAPDKGFVFDGRIAEDFKLSTGTKVPVGKLRVDLIAAPGQVTAVVGSNGVGKTTLFRVLLGFLQPWSGRGQVRSLIPI